MITDFDTVGLRGPTPADLATSEPTDFVDFVRNIGRDESKGLAGGTYGFGKAVLYGASFCSTIVVYTRTLAGGRRTSRLIAVALGTSYTSMRGKRFTGRHWWGVPDRHTSIEPLTGDEADALAAQLGMSAIPPGSTGTSIVVIAPRGTYEEESLEEIVQRIALAATWCAWPHMKGAVDVPSIRFSFTYEGKEVQRPEPVEHPVLRHYVNAYRRALDVLKSPPGDPPPSSWPWELHEIASQRPARRLGAAAFRRFPPIQGPMNDSPFGDVSSSIALTRNPRLIVKYLDVPRHPDGQSTAGIFVADPHLDQEFAASEPVAHDEWVPANLQLEKYERNPVKQALDKVREALQRCPPESVADRGTGIFAGTARLSSYLGGILTGQSGTGATQTEGLLALSSASSEQKQSGALQSGMGSRSGYNPRKRKVSIEFLGDPQLLVDDSGEAAVDFAFEVKNRGGDRLSSSRAQGRAGRERGRDPN